MPRLPNAPLHHPAVFSGRMFYCMFISTQLIKELFKVAKTTVEWVPGSSMCAIHKEAQNTCTVPSRSCVGLAEFSPLIKTTKDAAARTVACHVDMATGGSWHGKRALLFMGDPIV